MTALTEAEKNQFDMAVFVTGDADLIPAIQAVRKPPYGKRIKVFCPPGRELRELKRAFPKRREFMKPSIIESSRLPNEVKTPDGYVVKCPDKWKLHR